MRSVKMEGARCARPQLHLSFGFLRENNSKKRSKENNQTHDRKSDRENRSKNRMNNKRHHRHHYRTLNGKKMRVASSESAGTLGVRNIRKGIGAVSEDPLQLKTASLVYSEGRVGSCICPEPATNKNEDDISLDMTSDERKLQKEKSVEKEKRRKQKVC